MSEASTPPQRCVILHYHIFKNAGSSVDTILERNFGAGWVRHEFPEQPAAMKRRAIYSILSNNPEIRALSSHTMRLAPRDFSDIKVFPIVFLRHPIDRIRSGYGYGRSLSVGDSLAHKLDFANYVRTRLASANDRFCRNAQTWRLAMGERADTSSELERAIRQAERLPFIGCVEAFDLSMQTLKTLIAPWFAGFYTFPTFTNVLRAGKSLEERLDDIRAELGSTLHDELLAANADDLLLHSNVLLQYLQYD